MDIAAKWSEAQDLPADASRDTKEHVARVRYRRVSQWEEEIWLRTKSVARMNIFQIIEDIVCLLHPSHLSDRNLVIEIV